MDILKRTVSFLLKPKVFPAVSCLILIIKILVILFIRKSFPGYEDLAIAENLAKYGTYAEFVNIGPTAYKLPIYPLYLSFFLLLFGGKALPVIAVSQALLSFFIPILMIKITRLIDKEKIGIIAGYLFLFSPAYFYYPMVLEATNLLVPLLLLWLYQFLKLWLGRDISGKSSLLFGGTSALLFLTQVVVVPMAVLLIGAAIISRKISLKHASVIALTCMTIYSPWIIRNAYVFNRCIISKTPVWQNVYLGYTKGTQLFESAAVISEEQNSSITSLRNTTDEFLMEKIYREEVEKATRGAPYIFVKKAAGNFINLWYVPTKYMSDQSLSVVVGRKLFVFLLNIITILSLIMLYKRSRLLFLFSVLLLGNFTLPYLIGHAANIRFKLDFEWYQLLLAAFFISEFKKVAGASCSRRQEQDAPATY